MLRPTNRYRIEARRHQLALQKATEIEEWYKTILAGRGKPVCASPDDPPLPQEWSLRRLLEEGHCDIEDQRQREWKTQPLEGQLKLLMAHPDYETNYRRVLNSLSPHIVESHTLNTPWLDLARTGKFKEEWATLEQLAEIGQYAQHVTRIDKVRGSALDYVKSLRKCEKHLFNWLGQVTDIEKYLAPLCYRNGSAIDPVLEPLIVAVRTLRTMKAREVKDHLNMRKMIPDSDCGARESLSMKNGKNTASPPTNLGRHVAEERLKCRNVKASDRAELLFVWGLQSA